MRVPGRFFFKNIVSVGVFESQSSDSLGFARNEFLIGRKENFVSLMKMLRFGIQTGFLRKSFQREAFFVLEKAQWQPGPHFLFYDLQVFFFENCLGVLDPMVVTHPQQSEAQIMRKKVEQEKPATLPLSHKL